MMQNYCATLLGLDTTLTSIKKFLLGKKKTFLHYHITSALTSVYPRIPEDSASVSHGNKRFHKNCYWIHWWDTIWDKASDHTDIIPRTGESSDRCKWECSLNSFEMIHLHDHLCAYTQVKLVTPFSIVCLCSYNPSGPRSYFNKNYTRPYRKYCNSSIRVSSGTASGWLCQLSI